MEFHLFSCNNPSVKTLSDEMENELNAGNKEEAIYIAKDIKENEEQNKSSRETLMGLGMLQKVLDKIYQPLFTTKPTRQGTG